MNSITGNILVIDDNPKSKSSLEIAFPEYRFFSAPNGEEGLKLLERPHDFDVVLLDFKMSEGLNGLDVLRRMKRLDPALRVIILTGYGTRDIVLGALRGSTDDFLDKPYDPLELKAKIEKHLEKRREAGEAGQDTSGVQRIAHLLRKNYARLSLHDAAAVVSLSPKYISRIFKQEMKQGFVEFRTEIRMEEAKRLLRDSEMSVSQIAYKVGYENPESFIKMFKKLNKSTPGQYRNRAEE